MSKRKTKFNLSKLSKLARFGLKIAPFAIPLRIGAEMAENIFSGTPLGIGSSLTGPGSKHYDRVKKLKSEGVKGAEMMVRDPRVETPTMTDKESKQVTKLLSDKSNPFKMKYKKSSFPFKSKDKK